MLIYLHLGSLLTSQRAQVSRERFCKLPELQDISMAQPRDILMSRRSVLLAETGASFLLLDMQPGRVLGCRCFALWELLCRLASRICLQGTAFLCSSWSSRLGWNSVRLADPHVWQSSEWLFFPLSILRATWKTTFSQMPTGIYLQMNGVSETKGDAQVDQYLSFEC